MDLDPFRRISLDGGDEISERQRARHEGQDVDMVFDTADDDGWCPKVAARARKIGVHFSTTGLVTEVGDTILGGEDGVEINLGERLGQLWCPLVVPRWGTGMGGRGWWRPR